MMKEKMGLTTTQNDSKALDDNTIVFTNEAILSREEADNQTTKYSDL